MSQSDGDLLFVQLQGLGVGVVFALVAATAEVKPLATAIAAATPTAKHEAIAKSRMCVLVMVNTPRSMR
jgi:hypothetical protein